MAQHICAGDRERDLYKSEGAVCGEIEGAARDIRKFTGVESHVPAEGINRDVVRSNNAASSQEVAIQKRIKIIYRNISINLYRPFGIKKEIVRTTDRG